MSMDDEMISKMTGLSLDEVSSQRLERRLQTTMVAALSLATLDKWAEMKTLLEEAARYADTLAKAKAAGL